MYTQITCPNCKTPYKAEVHQVIDAARNPELKQQLLSGQLNMAICPSCGMGGQMATAMLFHDPAYEIFMIHVPQELNLNHIDREKLIGQLAQEAMNSLPAEERRAYMLQPQMMLSLQSFMEKVLETEGITPDMIARQKKQVELIQTLARADKDVADLLIEERVSEIDETFFSMLQAYVDAAANANDNQQLLKLTNLRAKLMIETAVGRQLEKQQIAVHGMSRDAKKENGLTPKLLLKHILIHQDDDDIVGALVNAGRGALSYSFFSLLTEELEKNERESNKKAAQKLTDIRQRLLEVYDSLQQESQRIMSEAGETLKEILNASDKEAAVRANLSRIDDAFMYYLSARIAEADNNGKADEMQALNEVHNLILKQVESQMPPEIILLNQLLEADSGDVQQQILNENQHLVNADLVKMLDAVSEELESSGRPELNSRLQEIKAMVNSRV